MRDPLCRSFLAATALALFASGCELMVELDRSAADAGADVECPICTDAAMFEDAEPDSSPSLEGGSSMDTGSKPADAGADGRVSDARVTE